MNSAFRNGNNRVQPCYRRYFQPLLMLYLMVWIRRQSRWVVLKPTTVKRKKCPSAPPKIPNNRKDAAFLKNQAMNIAVCILFSMNTAIVLTRKFKPNEFAKSKMTKLKFQTKLKIQWIKSKTFGSLEFGIWILFDICYLVLGNFLKEGLNRP